MKNVVRLCRNHWDRSAGAVLMIAGFVAILAGWLGTRKSVFAFEQIPVLISGGIAGVALITVGVGFWVSADLRDTWRKLDDIDATLNRTGVTFAEPIHLEARDRVPAEESLAR